MDFIRVHNYEGFKDLALEVDKGILYLEGGTKEREAIMNVMRVVFSKCFMYMDKSPLVEGEERYEMKRANFLKRKFLDPYIEIHFTSLLRRVVFSEVIRPILNRSILRSDSEINGNAMLQLAVMVGWCDQDSLHLADCLDAPIIALYPQNPRKPLFSKERIGSTKYIYTEPLSASGPSIDALLALVHTNKTDEYAKSVLRSIEFARRMMVKVLTFGGCLFGTTEELVDYFRSKLIYSILYKNEDYVRLERIVFDLCLRVASTFSNEGMIEEEMKSVSGFVFIDSIDLSSNGDGLRMTEGIKRCFPNITVIATSSKVPLHNRHVGGFFYFLSLMSLSPFFMS